RPAVRRPRLSSTFRPLLATAFLLIRPRPRRSTLFPYTTLFRSPGRDRRRPPPGAGVRVPPRPHRSTDRPATCRRCVRPRRGTTRSEEHTSELQSRFDLVCRLLLEKKKGTEKD